MTPALIFVRTLKCCFSEEEITKPDLTGGKYEDSLCDSGSPRAGGHGFLGLVPHRADCGHSSPDATRTSATPTHPTNSRAGCHRSHRSLYRVPQTPAADFCRPGYQF